MLYAWSAFDYISLVDHADRLSPFLIVASTFGDKQDLTTWMNMPVQLRTGTINCLSNTRIEGTISNIEFTEPNIARVILGGGQLTFWENSVHGLCLGLEDGQKAHRESDDVKFCSHVLNISFGFFHSVHAANSITLKQFSKFRLGLLARLGQPLRVKP